MVREGGQEGFIFRALSLSLLITTSPAPTPTCIQKVAHAKAGWGGVCVCAWDRMSHAVKNMNGRQKVATQIKIDTNKMLSFMKHQNKIPVSK